MPKKKKAVVELTSLDEWIAQQEELHKDDPPPEKTPEEIQKEKIEQARFAKMEKKQKVQFLARKAQEYRDHMSALYEIFKKEEAERKERERIALEIREKAEFALVPIRRQQLKHTLHKIRKMEIEAWNFEKKTVLENEWNLYLNCFPLPYPENVQDMNAYTSNWLELKLPDLTLDEAIKRSEDVMYFIKAMERNILKPLGAPRSKINLWRNIVQDLKLLLQRNINYGTYFILRDVSKKMFSEDAKIATFQKDTKFFSLALWAQMTIPKPLKDPLAPPEPSVVVSFDKPRSTFIFPSEINLSEVAVRILSLQYDHVSWQSRVSLDCPDDFADNFYEYVEDEWRMKQELKFSRKHSTPSQDAVQINSDEDLTERRWKYNRDVQPVPSVFLDHKNEEICQKVLQRLLIEDKEQMINLSKYLIVGGVNHLDLLCIPRQPNRLMMDVTAISLELPKKLQELPYNKIQPDPEDAKKSRTVISKKKSKFASISLGLLTSVSKPQLHKPQSSITPLDIPSEEMDKLEKIFKTLSKIEMEKSEKESEKELSKEELEQALYGTLVQIKMEIPENIFWIDSPILCYWDDQKKYWTTKTVEDCHVSENMSEISFRIAKFGIYGFAVKKHHCFPFKAWNLMPFDRNTIKFNLETKLFTFRFSVTENIFRLDRIIGIPPEKTNSWNILGVNHHLHEIVEKLRLRGIDIFPSFDTFNYVSESSEKHWIMERHMYYCMSLVAFGYEMLQSKWNLQSGLRQLFFQVREIESKKFRVVFMNQWETRLIQTTEDEFELNLDSIKGLPFSADFYQLSLNSASYTTKRHIEYGKSETLYSVFELLCAFRPLSFTYFEMPQPPTPPESSVE